MTLSLVPAILFDWGEDGFLSRPASFDAFIKQTAGDAFMLDPLSESPRVRSDRYLTIISFIVGLFDRRAPATVGGAISLIIIDAIDASSVWFFAHISKKDKEIGAPSRTHGNATPPVATIGYIPRVFAAIDHVAPKFMHRGARHAVGRGARYCRISSQATAGPYLSAAKIIPKNSDHCPARTPAGPVGVAVPIPMGKGLHGETAKRLFKKVKSFHHILRQCVRQVGCAQAVGSCCSGATLAHAIIIPRVMHEVTPLA